MLNSDVKPEKMIDLHIKMDKPTYDKVCILAGTRRETVSAVMRRVLAAGLDNEIARQSSDVLTAAVRSAIRSELKSTENRLAKLASKAGITAATGLITADDIIVRTSHDSNERAKTSERLANARARAVRYLNTSEPKGDDDNA